MVKTDMLGDHWKVALKVAVIISAVVISLVMWLLNKEAPITSGSLYAYDLATKTLFTTSETTPPFAAPSGPLAGVLAQVITIADEPQPVAVYLMRYTPAAKEAIASFGSSTPEARTGLEVCRPGDSNWVPAHLPDGVAIRNRIAEVAGDRPWKIASPP